MMRGKIIILFFVAGLLGGISHAAITLSIDSANEEFYFSGSDAGVTDAGWFSWSSAAFVTGEEPSVNISSAFSLSGGYNVFDAYIWFADAGVEISISPDVFTPTALTVTGGGSDTTFSYASLSPFLKSMFESQTSLSLEDGSGFSAMPVQAVPEPATLLLFVIGGVGAWILQRNARTEKCREDI